MKNGIIGLCLLTILLACNKTITKTTASPNSNSSIFIEVKDAGIDDPNNKIIGNWMYEVEGCVNDKEIKENINLNIAKSGTVIISGNAFNCNDCSQNFKITKDQLLTANRTINANGIISISGAICTELACMTDFCGEKPKLIRLSNMKYSLAGDVLTIQQNENSFRLLRQKE